jgi:HTH-type transcriptional repressor of NAD biosynthesis genes
MVVPTMQSPPFNTGLVMGKFWPPHKGHKHVIDTALAQSKEVGVVICVSSAHDIPGPLRAQWLKEIHPAARVLLLDQDKLDPNDEAAWTAATLQTLGYAPEAMFSSEHYGEHYASLMGSTHVMVDQLRQTIPCTATQIRQDPLQYLEFLEPCVQKYYKQRNRAQ